MSSTAEQMEAAWVLRPARNVLLDELPWVPLAEGKSFKPLRFLSGGRGFVELLRMEPGTFSPLHRHTGEVHAFNLEGSRELCTGELIGPGGYVYEPPGNIDTWRVVGDVPLLVLVVVMGVVEFLGAQNEVIHIVSANTLMDLYHQHCAAHKLLPIELID